MHHKMKDVSYCVIDCLSRLAKRWRVLITVELLSFFFLWSGFIIVAITYLVLPEEDSKTNGLFLSLLASKSRF